MVLQMYTYVKSYHIVHFSIHFLVCQLNLNKTVSKKKDIVEVPWWSSGYDSFHSHGPGSIPGQEINIPQAMQQHHPTPRKKDAENFHTLMVGV